MAHVKHSDEFKAKAVAMYDGGMSYTDVARDMGVDRETVSRWCRNAGAPARQTGYGDDLKEYAVAMYDDGMSYTDAASATGVSRRTLWKWCRDAGKGRTFSEASGYCSSIRDGAVAMHVTGVRFSDVARKFGVSRGTVSRWCWDAGVACRSTSVSEISKSIRRSAKMDGWTESVKRRHIERVGWLNCSWCDSPEDLQVDHIEKFAHMVRDRLDGREPTLEIEAELLADDTLFNPLNGRVLCTKCHRKTATYGKGGGVRQQYLL